jgi:hypothetical protein
MKVYQVKTPFNAFLSIKDGHRKAHGNQKDAMRCYKQYLLRQGYKQVGQREFQKDNNHVLFLPKVGSFGLPLKKGKEGRSMSKCGHGGIF